MTHVIFTEAFDFTPKEDRRVTMSYRAGPDPVSVRKDCADQAIAAGKAKKAPAPSRKKPGQDPLDHDNDGRKGGSAPLSPEEA
jgi:hypothetical protein